jgi:single-strand DNA-binding protein
MDPIYPINRLYRYPSRLPLIKIISIQGKEHIMLNSCILTGNLGADPEVFYSSEGEPIATFNLAFKSSKKSKTGWIKITCFRRLAEVAEKYLHKGARIGIVGTLDQQKWETDEGVQRSSFQMIANSIEFIKTDGRGFEEGQGDEDIPI